MNILHIMVGGPESELPDLSVYDASVPWIGVDRGAIRLTERGIIPIIAMGDFDSLSKSELEHLKTITEVTEFPAEKDETDTAIGLKWALNQKPDLIRIFGATGGRLDHLLANIMMLMQPEFLDVISKIELIDRYNYIKMYTPGEYTVSKIQDKKYAAFITMANVTKLTLKGFKYPLTEANYPFGAALSSNEFSAERGTFSFQTGLILFIQSND
ncbi:thiamine diphosphokinase [Paenilisteria rocourtiae]|uniref:Thiamine diphosphokinase n=1 Tax=Listeria rocourtiae TaxID=647910 RepID=A0A4R6ZR91_9LIST|nr:thiamine diphosphokinase [Listeria rocourtiae]EUJ49314.1 kinase [Listeria rocourtiae FSL F6-920]MBC1435920.1 thiamine diphosphokinase [Listeria rocourtiae]MBC1603522.1 thiamine diphosphokinase [Listeria rocourtiae]TDR55193.1 thiamine diphosphokinase [Listeria rocourtiae]